MGVEENVLTSRADIRPVVNLGNSFRFAGPCVLRCYLIFTNNNNHYDYPKGLLSSRSSRNDNGAVYLELATLYK